MPIIAFILAMLIGLSLGLIGSGGSILTIPVLVYLLHITPTDATTYSLFIVGVAALVGSLKTMKDKLLDLEIALYFGLPSIGAVVMMRTLIMPLLPHILFEIAGFRIHKDIFIMTVFATLMILASFAMIGKKVIVEPKNFEINIKILVLNGFLIGTLTGFLGIGGGFLIIPTLLFSANMPLKKAVATSLVIIAFTSLIGFVSSWHTQTNWTLLFTFTAFAICGVLIGTFLNKKISNEKLKPTFGWFVLLTGIYIIIKEILQ